MSPEVCPECSRGLPTGAPAGMCPNCLLQLGFAAAERSAPATGAELDTSLVGINRSFGDYELLEEVARGGMGVVFRARQLSLNRTVAVKLVHGGVFATPNHVKRFKLEAETAARLNHPNIVSIYEVGEQDSQPFFSMRLVEGGTLLDAMKRRRFSPREAAEMMRTIAAAVHFAHQRGVLHRDLKPTNILMDAEGCPHITDFGLAKLLEDESDLTLTLAVMGTPTYMSPEQAAGKTKDLTTAADTYSLGVMLYELLSGRPPFAGTTTAAVLRQVVETEPPSIRKRNPTVDADLETICLKCLEKDPARRYGTAAELSEELERWLAGRPILARPISAAERLSRWSKRNPVLASVSVALLLSLLIGGFMLDRAFRRTRAALHASLVTQARAQLAGGQFGQRFDVLAALRQAAAIQNTLEVRSEAAAALAKPDARVLRKWPDALRGETQKLSFSPDLETYVVDKLKRGCELRSTKDQSLVRFFPHESSNANNLQWRVQRVVFSRDGKRLAALYYDQSVDVWDVDGVEPILKLYRGGSQWGNLDFHPSGREVACYTRTNGLFTHHLDTGERHYFGEPKEADAFLRYDPAGERLAIVQSNRVAVWSFVEQRMRWSLSADSYVAWAAWSPDGRLLAMASSNNRDILLLDAATGKLRTRFARHLADPYLFEFHPDGQWVASTAADGTLRFWDKRNGQPILEANLGNEHALQFAADGKRLAAGVARHLVGILEFRPSEIFREFQGTSEGEEPMSGMVSSRSGRFLITAGLSDFRIWDTAVGREVAVEPTSSVRQPAYLFFGADDKEIIYSRVSVGTFRYPFSWQEDSDGGTARVQIGPRQSTPVPKNTVVVSIGQNQRSWLIRNGKTGAELWPDGQPESARNVAPSSASMSFSPDGRWAAIKSIPPGKLEVWDTATQQKAATIQDQRISLARFSPDGTWLVYVAEAGYQLVDTTNWRELSRFAHEDAVNCSFARNGRLLALLHGDSVVDLVAMPEAKIRIRLKPPQTLTASSISLGTDGSRLWLLGAGHRVYEWNLTALRQELAKLGLDWQD